MTSPSVPAPYQVLKSQHSYNDYVIIRGTCCQILDVKHRKCRDNSLTIPYNPQVTGELFLLRGIVKDDKVTILNTDKFDQEHVKLYITFYIKDPELQIKIFE